MGGLRLVQATCKKFYEFCDQRGIALPRRNFTLSYDTNIPRQVSQIMSYKVTCFFELIFSCQRKSYNTVKYLSYH